MRKPIARIVRRARPAQNRSQPSPARAARARDVKVKSFRREPKLPEARQKRCQPPVDAAVAVLEKTVLPDRRNRSGIDRTELGGQCARGSGECDTGDGRTRHPDRAGVLAPVPPSKLTTAITDSHTRHGGPLPQRQGGQRQNDGQSAQVKRRYPDLGIDARYPDQPRPSSCSRHTEVPQTFGQISSTSRYGSTLKG